MIFPHSKPSPQLTNPLIKLTAPFPTRLQPHRPRLLRLSLPLNPHIRQLLKPTQCPPPVLPGLILRDPFQQLGRLEPHILVLVEQPEGEVKQPRLRLGRDAEQQADLVVRVNVLGKGVVDFFGLGGRQALVAEAVVQMGEVETLEGADRVELGDVLRGGVSAHHALKGQLGKVWEGRGSIPV